MAAGLIGELLRPVLGMGDQAVAADAHQLDPFGIVLLQACELRFHMFHKRAVGAEHHQQHRPVVQIGVMEGPTGDLRQFKGRQGRAERQHRGGCEGHDGSAHPLGCHQDGCIR